MKVKLLWMSAAVIALILMGAAQANSQEETTTTAPGQTPPVVTGGESAESTTTDSTSADLSGSDYASLSICYTTEFLVELQRTDPLRCWLDGEVVELSSDDLQTELEGITGNEVNPWAAIGLTTNFGTRSVPLSHYKLTADTGWRWGVSNPEKSAALIALNFMFQSTVYLTMAAVSIFDMSLNFPVTRLLIDEASLMAQKHSVELLGFRTEVSVYRAALSIAMVVVGLKFAFKGLVEGFTELGFVLVAYTIVLSVVATSSFGDAGIWAAERSSELSRIVIVQGSGHNALERCAAAISPDQANAEEIEAVSALATQNELKPACSLAHPAQRAVLETPYQLLQWGAVLDGRPGLERCSSTSWQVLMDGRSAKQKSWDQMAKHEECQQFATYNKHPHGDRLWLAAFLMVNGWLVMLFILLSAMNVYWQGNKLIWLTLALPFVLVLAILPGPTRSLAYGWATGIIAAGVRVVMVTVGLVVYLSGLGFLARVLSSQILFFLISSICFTVLGFGGMWKFYKMGKRYTEAAAKVAKENVGRVANTNPTLESALQRRERNDRLGRAALSTARDVDRVRYLGRRIVR